MTTIALNGLWTYIQTLNLSKRNRRWLAEKLVAPDTLYTVESKDEYEPNETTKAAILEAQEMLQACDDSKTEDVDTSSVEAMLHSCGL